MELTLTLETRTQVAVACNGQPSHTFDLLSLLPATRPEHVLKEPQGFGRLMFAALFPAGSQAAQALAAQPGRLLLVALDESLQAIPWEFTYGPQGYIALELPLLRGLPPEQRVEPPVLDTPLHILAVPSNPIAKDIPPLNIEAEWHRLREAVDGLPHALTLERVRPATIDQLRRLALPGRQRVVHFMGHGGSQDGQATLLFEREDGAPQPVSAQSLVQELGKRAFLVTLNACASAQPGPVEFANLALTLVKHRVPYALGMQFLIPDSDALAFGRAFYQMLVSGAAVEEAVTAARRTLSRDSHNPWAVGTPVLYTCLEHPPVAGFLSQVGEPKFLENLPGQVEVDGVLFKAQGAFQGRTAELLALGKALTGADRPYLLTLHGAGGHGKTALARQAVDRFGWAFPGGVWAISLEDLPDRGRFLAGLARFLKIDIEGLPEADEIERRVLPRLRDKRMLIVLDNAETLIQAVERDNRAAQDLVGLLRERLNGTRLTLLVTSREYLNWPAEQVLDLGGLVPDEGAALFRQAASGRMGEVDQAGAQALSVLVGGHPLSLLLLGGAFNDTVLSLEVFTHQHEVHLAAAEDRYRAIDHRHRKLFAAFDTSVSHLPEEARALLSKLWVFRAAFLPKAVAEMLDTSVEHPEEQPSPVYAQLHHLRQRSLLEREEKVFASGVVLLYRLLPGVRLYIEQVFKPKHAHSATEIIRAMYAHTYAGLLQAIYGDLNRSAEWVWVAQQGWADFAAAGESLPEAGQGWYWLRWGWVSHRLGAGQAGLRLLERALEAAQGSDQELEWHALNNMGAVYRGLGQPQQALELFEQALPIQRDVGNRSGKATTLNNMGAVYDGLGQPQRALALYQQALSILREVSDRGGEATTLNNMGALYQGLGQPKQALALYERALPIQRKVGDRAGEAATLNNMGALYQALGQPQQALALYAQALPIRREVGDRAGEAATLNNMGRVYVGLGQSEPALALYAQALPISREVGDRTGEANTLNNMGGVYDGLGQPQRALKLFEQALPILREVGDRAGEATTLFNLAVLLAEDLGHMQEAVALVERSAALLRKAGLPQDAAWRTLSEHEAFLAELKADLVRKGVSKETMQAIQEWVDALTWTESQAVLERLHQVLFEPEVEAIFEENIRQAELVQDEAFAQWIRLHLWLLRESQANGIAVAYSHLEALQQQAQAAKTPPPAEPAPSPIPPEFIERCVIGLAGGEAEQEGLLGYLALFPTSEPGFDALLRTVQVAAFEGQPVTTHGLEGVFAEAWQEIVRRVWGEPVDPKTEA